MTLEEDFRRVMRFLIEGGRVSLPETTWILEDGIVRCTGAPEKIDLHKPQNMEALLGAFNYCMIAKSCLYCNFWD